MSAAARFVAWAGALFGLWLLLVGTNAGLEAIGGACAAVAAAAFQAAHRRCSERRIAASLRDALPFWPVPLRILRDFGIVVYALFVRRRGAFRAVRVPVGGDNPRSRGRRALVAVLGSLAPNTYVVEVDAERKLALLHDLVSPRADRELL